MPNTERKKNHRLILLAMEAGQRISRYWGPHVGLALVAAYYSDEYWLTAAELAERAGVSEDTAKRRLSDLAKIGRVDTARRGRQVCYRASRTGAEQTAQILNELVSAATCG